ncbi:hypothetical protein EFY87_05725 [Flexivirga caeni]|uniref:Transposase DDE domain-containing protein n=2 Tax=Flexivirga caeni TaxID=2294115 RepID=A0A3M9MDY3_9MICO|nr:hypothetical protein EFY87_05725 [Flexivirga caeni]
MIGVRGNAVPYSQIESAFEDLARGFHPTVDKTTGEVHDARIPFTPTEFNSAIARAAIPECIPEPAEQALDSTDIETFACRRSWSKDGRPDLPDGSLEVDDKAPKPRASETGWPRVGDDGRFIHTKDREAREGWRSERDGKLPVFNGFDLHLLVDATPWGEQGYPPLIRALALAPAGTLKSEPGLDAIRAAKSLGSRITCVLVDRGYSILTTDHWCGPLAEEAVEQVFTLHTNQRGQHPGPMSKTLVIDGGLFVDSVPPRLRELPPHNAWAPKREQLELAAQYDEREAFAFRSTRRPDGANQQYEGPARAGKVRCANNPESMRLSAATHPTTNCVRGEQCSCSTRKTLGREYLRLRQRHRYGTTRWLADYGRRNSVESANSIFKVHEIGFTKNTVRVFGRLKHGLWAALAAAVINLHLVETGYGIEPCGQLPAGPIEPLLPVTPSKALHCKIGRRGPPPKDINTLLTEPKTA